MRYTTLIRVTALIEHVVPISRHGSTEVGNVVPACKGCNYRKFNKHVEVWLRAYPDALKEMKLRLEETVRRNVETP